MRAIVPPPPPRVGRRRPTWDIRWLLWPAVLASGFTLGTIAYATVELVQLNVDYWLSVIWR
jgi:hypothetical protein